MDVALTDTERIYRLEDELKQTKQLLWEAWLEILSGQIGAPIRSYAEGLSVQRAMVKMNEVSKRLGMVVGMVGDGTSS